MYPYIHLFNKEITSYTIMALIGVLIVGFCCVRRCGKFGFDDNKMIIMLLFGLLGAFIGGHLLYGLINLPLLLKVINNWNQITSFSMFIELFRIIFGGSVFYGGLFGGILGAFIYVKKAKLDGKLASFIVTPFIPLFHFFGRIGCFLYGCCYGIESSFGFIYPTILSEQVVKRFPVQLLEAGFNFVLFLMLLILEKKGKFKQNILSVYLFIYALGRFLIEFLRGDSYRGIYSGLSTSQWISLIVILGTLIYAILIRKKQLQ